MRKTTTRRFWEKVDRRGPDECWPWLAGSEKLGYGKFGLVQGKVVRSHRHVWELTNGPITSSLVCVLHRCDNRLCCNPAHMFLGSREDNMKDIAAKGRAPRGIRSAMAKVTEADVIQIRRLQKTGLTYDQLAEKFPITRAQIHRIVQGRRWGHVR